MIDGLKLAIPREEQRVLLLARTRHHEQRAESWTHQQTRPSQDRTHDAPLLPAQMCRNEAERHLWRGGVLTFIGDHLETGERYPLGVDLRFGEVLPARVGRRGKGVGLAVEFTASATAVHQPRGSGAAGGRTHR